MLSLLAVGCGLLLEQLAGVRVRRLLLPGLGLCVVILVGQLLTLLEATAQLTTPVVLALAVAGFAAAAPWRGRTPIAIAPLASGAAVFAVFAAPVVLSGEPTFGGYVRLDDTASWLGITARIMEHGYTLDGLAPSSYEAMLDFYIGSDYPIGAFIPFGIGSELLGQDVAWLYQPWMAFIAAQLALALYLLAERFIESRAARAAAAFIAAQPALLYGFGLWGGAKELAAAWTLALLAALTPQAISGSLRGVVPSAIVAATTLAILSVGGGIWMLPPLLLGAALALRRSGLRPTARRAGLLAALALPLSIPALLASGFLSAPAASTITDRERLANLIEPLSELQAFGIWPVADFRLRPDDKLVTYVLIAVVIAGIALGAAQLWSRRRDTDQGLAIFAGAASIGCLVVLVVGSPWVAAKALAIASPALVLVAFVGVFAVYRRGRRVEAAVAAIAIAGGVLWSNALGYQGINLGPHDRLSELETIGEKFAGEGPALMTEYEPFGVRHFLRDLDPEGASELRRRQVQLRDGRVLGKGEPADADAFSMDALFVYRTLVLRRSASASRPPSPYNLAWQGRFHEVWQREAGAPPSLLEHLPLGEGFDPAETARCSDVRRLAGLQAGGRLAAVERPPVVSVDLSAVPDRPEAWAASQARGAVEPDASGTLRTTVTIPETGRQEFWLGGAFRGGLTLDVDGERVGSGRHELSHGGQFAPLGTADLAAGSHRVELELATADLHPGSGGRPGPFGPLVISTATADQPVTVVSTADADSLCGKRLDWIEALG